MSFTFPFVLVDQFLGYHDAVNGFYVCSSKAKFAICDPVGSVQLKMENIE